MVLEQGSQESNVIQLTVAAERSSAAILKFVCRVVNDKTDYLLSGLATNVADAFFEEMSGSDEQEKLARHFHVMREFKICQKDMQIKFHELMGQLWRTLRVGMDDSKLPAPTGPVAELVRQFSNRTANHYKVLLRETGQRLQTLCHPEVSEHPLHPEYFCRAFWHSIAGLDLSYDERLKMMRLFNRFVMDRYGQVLVAANTALIEFKVETTLHRDTSSQ